MDSAHLPSVESLRCPRCSEPMAFLLQVIHMGIYIVIIILTTNRLQVAWVYGCNQMIHMQMHMPIFKSHISYMYTVFYTIMWLCRYIAPWMHHRVPIIAVYMCLCAKRKLVLRTEGNYSLYYTHTYVVFYNFYFPFML